MQYFPTWKWKRHKHYILQPSFQPNIYHPETLPRRNQQQQLNAQNPFKNFSGFHDFFLCQRNNQELYCRSLTMPKNIISFWSGSEKNGDKKEMWGYRRENKLAFHKKSIVKKDTMSVVPPSWCVSEFICSSVWSSSMVDCSTPKPMDTDAFLWFGSVLSDDLFIFYLFGAHNAWKVFGCIC